MSSYISEDIIPTSEKGIIILFLKYKKIENYRKRMICEIV